MIGLTPGNLITDLRKLENAGYLTTDKTGNGSAARASVALTQSPVGRVIGQPEAPAISRQQGRASFFPASCAQQGRGSSACNARPAGQTCAGVRRRAFSSEEVSGPLGPGRGRGPACRARQGARGRRQSRYPREHEGSYVYMRITASMCSVRLCAAGPASATSPLLSARSTRWGLRIIARHTRVPAKRAGDEVATSGCSTVAVRAMTPLDSGNPWRVGAGAVKTCLDADVNRWSRCCRIAHTNRPELGVRRGNYVQSLTARSRSLQGKARAADRLLHITGR